MISGSCLCGGVAFEISGEIAAPLACHCIQCRKQSGHYWVSAHVAKSDLNLTRQDTLDWYRASDMARRGFCKGCGSFLFWQEDARPEELSVSAGSLDGPTGLDIRKHIFTAFKGDYYDITDGKPQEET